MFDASDVISDVTELRQIQPSIFMFEWNYHIFTITIKRLDVWSLNFMYGCTMEVKLYPKK